MITNGCSPNGIASTAISRRPSHDRDVDVVVAQRSIRAQVADEEIDLDRRMKMRERRDRLRREVLRRRDHADGDPSARQALEGVQFVAARSVLDRGVPRRRREARIGGAKAGAGAVEQQQPDLLLELLELQRERRRRHVQRLRGLGERAVAGDRGTARSCCSVRFRIPAFSIFSNAYASILNFPFRPRVAMMPRTTPCVASRRSARTPTEERAMAFGSTLDEIIRSRPAARHGGSPRRSGRLPAPPPRCPVSSPGGARRRSTAATAAHADGDGQKRSTSSPTSCSFRRSPARPSRVATEEREPVVLRRRAPSLVIDPLDGSSNIGAQHLGRDDFRDLRRRRAGTRAAARIRQLAAGFFIYGPQTALVLTLGGAVSIFTLERESGTFRLTADRAPSRAHQRIRDQRLELPALGRGRARFIDDCVQGAEGPRGENFNMRWIASLVAEAYRILVRGGVFLYPADRRRSTSTAGCASSTRRTRSRSSWNGPAAPPPTA